MEQNIISTQAQGANSVHSSDLDGDIDVLSASSSDDKIAWYENLTILGVEKNLDSKIEIHPNPAQKYIYLENNEGVSLKSMQLYDTYGRLVLEKKDDFQEIDIRHLESGLYFLNLYTFNGSMVKKMIKN